MSHVAERTFTHPARRRTRRRRWPLVASLALATLPLAGRDAAAQCYQHPFTNTSLSSAWGETAGRPNPHRGADYPRGAGTEVWAIADGVVVDNTSTGCLGYVLVIAHADGMFSSYSHLLGPSPLAIGTPVRMGQGVAQVGNTGTCTTGPHLHLNMSDHADGAWAGSSVDPYAWIEARKDGTEHCSATRLLEQADYARPRSTDVDGDGDADLCARDGNGLRCWTASAAGWSAPWAALPWTDANGWGDVSNNATLRMGDLDGDGRADVCGRSDADVTCALSTGAGFAAETV